MTGAEYEAIKTKCSHAWRTELRGGLVDADFDDFVQNVAIAVWQGAKPGIAIRNALRDMRRVEEREAAVKAQVAFELYGELPAHFEVPHGTWGGARPNSGGRRLGAGRPKKSAA